MKKRHRKHKTAIRRPTPEVEFAVPPPRNLTPELCEKLRKEMASACRNIAKTHGLTAEEGQLFDVDLRHSLNFSLKVGIPREGGEIYSPEKALFEVLAPEFGLRPTDYGQTFWTSNDQYRITSINPNRPKYPISAERVYDGQGFKFSAYAILVYLGRNQ